MQPPGTQSQSSFDSDLPLSQLSLSQSTQSLPSEHPRALPHSQPANPHDSSVELPPINLEPPPDFELGFSNGFGAKPICIHESKLKQARAFFEETQLESPSTVNYRLFPQAEKRTHSPETPEELSMPCFKTMGRGLEIKVSAEAREKAELLLQSVTKPTKAKRGSKRVSEDIIRTVNINKLQQKENKEERYSQGRRSFFNWEAYLKECQDIDQSRRSAGRMDGLEDTVRVNLQDLNSEIAEESEKWEQLQKLSANLPDISFKHIMSSCSIQQCILCHINFTSQRLGSEEYYQLMQRQFCKPNLAHGSFGSLFQECCFKLMRFECLWPEVVNRRCNASNLVVELNKKILELEKRGQCSWLRQLVERGPQGQQISVVVRDMCHNSTMKILFLLLSDGWYSVWSATEANNLLYDCLLNGKKLRVGSKMCLNQWSRHPIPNILDFCPKATEMHSLQCIQFTYNGSILLKPTAKLGHTNFTFCRPLSMCRFKGGVVPTLWGTVIRFITVREATRREKEVGLTHHLVEMLLLNGSTCLVRFVLNQQSCLADWFRLYRFYLLSRLTLNQDGTLSFSMKSSKYQEIKQFKINEKDGLYPQGVVALLKKRLLSHYRPQNLKEGASYDVVCSDGTTQLHNSPVPFQLEGQTLSKGTVLYQQVCLSNATKGGVVCTRGKYSSRSGKLPRIYNTFLSS